MHIDVNISEHLTAINRHYDGFRFKRMLSLNRSLVKLANFYVDILLQLFCLLIQ